MSPPYAVKNKEIAMPTPQAKHKKKIDIKQVVSYLNHTFYSAQQESGLGSKCVRGTLLHTYQVDFCHMINTIQRGPSYIVPKTISAANELIEQLKQEKVTPSTS